MVTVDDALAALRTSVMEHGERFGCWRCGAIQDAIAVLERAYEGELLDRRVEEELRDDAG